MTVLGEQNLSKLGFRFGRNGPHAARTLMLDDMRLLLAHTPVGATRAEYAEAIIGANVLGKATKKARELALRHMAVLYGLDAQNPIFRALRRLWPLDAAAQPVLALAVALARDPLLRASQRFILNTATGTPVPRDDVAGLLATTFADRFSAASLKSFAQNIAGTWTAAGYLQGHRRKTRAHVPARPEPAALCLFLGFLEGRTGQRLFSSNWMRLLGGSADELEALTKSASHRGLLMYMSAGGVKEVRFPGYLRPDEEQVLQEISHVV